MSQLFTDRASRVLQLANQEAQRFGHEYVGTEHILLGLIKEGAGVAANVLNNLDVGLRTIRLEVEKFVQPEPDRVLVGQLHQTPRTRQVIEYALEEARNLNHNYVGTEHLLLGLLRAEGLAARILMNLSLKPQDVRQEVLNLLGGPTPGVRLDGLPTEEFPASIQQTLKELDVEIEQLTLEKEAAVAQGDFEMAVRLRDRADASRRTRSGLLLEWRGKHLPDPSWLAWNGGAVVALAQVIGGEQRWEELPILADALEEAGCMDQEMLAHCRQPGEHRAGCWVVALLLDTSKG